MKIGLLGEKLGHSHSPLLHGYLGDYEYDLIEVSREDFDSFMRKHDFSAINVTIPYKEKVIPYLDELDYDASRIGAVNLIINEDGKLKGYNTDIHGFLLMTMRLRLFDFEGKDVLILGTGGAAKMADYACKEVLHAHKVTHVSRNPNKGQIGYDELREVAGSTNIIINATPVGMYPNITAKSVDLRKFSHLEAVFDLVYNPLRTRLILQAEELGIPCVGGLTMLVGQGVQANEFIFHKEMDEVRYEVTYKKMRDALENIVLIGMPTSGKTKIGREYAYRYGYEFIDTDAYVANKVGMPVDEFIKANGIASFREEERLAIEEIRNKSHVVIATGGGVILDERNVLNLKANGRLYFRDLPLDKLKARDDRPLSSSLDDLHRLYAERHGLYKKYADVIIKDDYDIEEAIRLIGEDRQ